jgi:hypothetical protein
MSMKCATLTVRAMCSSAAWMALAVAAGCAAPVKTPSTRATGLAAPDDDQVGDLIRHDPEAYLESCLDRCRKIDELTTTFYRQERLGVVPVLHPVERIFVKWRRSPLSIKFNLPDETSEYLESLYIQGRNKNELLALPRRGLLGLPPGIISVPVQWSITFQKAKNPITDFGPERMLERVLYKIKLARKYGGPVIEYKGVVKLQISGQVVHHILIVNPPKPEFPHAKVDLYIDPVLQIPVGSYCWAKDDVLDGMYLYADINVSPHLTDADFTIKPPPSTRPTSKPAASGPAPKAAAKPS